MNPGDGPQRRNGAENSQYAQRLRVSAVRGEKPGWREWLGGVGLAAGFFLPIAAAREVDDAMLMWTRMDTAELLTAFVVVAALAVWLLARVRRVRAPRASAIALVMLAIPTGMSLMSVSGRAIRETFGSPAMPAWAPLAGTAAVALVIASALAFMPDLTARALRRLFAFGALFVAPLFSFGLSVRAADAPTAAPVRAPAADTCGDIHVLLFDELSYSGAFRHGQPTLSNLTRLTPQATVYHAARAPLPAPPHSPNTVDAIGRYINARAARSGDPGLATGPFGIAHQKGYRTEVVGWYFPYCAVLGAYADACREYSFYNVSTLYESFAPWAPIETAVNLWPYQLPTGIARRPIAARLHAASLREITRDATAAPASGPVFRWAHFNVPHMPWLENAGPLSFAAFTLSDDRYAKQTDTSNRALGDVIDSLAARGALERATIVVTADHGLREEFGGHEPLHVPLVVRTPGGSRADRDDPVEVAEVLRDVVGAACQ